MLTVVNAQATSFDYRTGVNNNSAVSGLSRQKSLYFMRFHYPNTPLSQNTLHDFKGNRQENTTHLNWTFNNQAGQVQEIVLEKSTNGISFTPIKTLNPDKNNMGNNISYLHVDADPVDASGLYYRLKIIHATGTTYSRLLFFDVAADQLHLFNISPAVISTSASISINAIQVTTAELYLYTTAGQLVYKQRFAVHKGTNNLPFQTPAHLRPGVYIANLYLNGVRASKKIVIER
jgi:hypothetical protein